MVKERNKHKTEKGGCDERRGLDAPTQRTLDTRHERRTRGGGCKLHRDRMIEDAEVRCAP